MRRNSNPAPARVYGRFLEFWHFVRGLNHTVFRGCSPTGCSRTSAEGPVRFAGRAGPSRSPDTLPAVRAAGETDRVFPIAAAPCPRIVENPTRIRAEGTWDQADTGGAPIHPTPSARPPPGRETAAKKRWQYLHCARPLPRTWFVVNRGKFLEFSISAMRARRERLVSLWRELEDSGGPCLPTSPYSIRMSTQ